MQKRVQIQSWTPGAVLTKKRKGNFSQQPQEQWIKSPQSTWCNLPLWNTWIDKESFQTEEVDFGSKDIYIYFPFFSFCECVCVCFCVWFCLYSFDFTTCSRVLSVHLKKFFLLLLKNFFLIIIFYFNNFILFYFILFYHLSFFLFSLLFWAIWMKGSWCSSQASGLCLCGGRPKFRTLVHKRPPSST